MPESDRAAVVTGGGSGIGLAIARHLVSEGMDVVAADRDAAALGGARAILEATDGGKAVVAEADIGTLEGAARAIDCAIEQFGRIDLLVNNAAVHPLELLEDHDIGTWHETFRVNLDGTLMCAQAALPHMKAQGGGAIVNMGSVSGRVPYATGGAYAASKAAIEMLTKVLAIEAGPHGVTVNCIAPGSIRHRPGDEARDSGPPRGIPIGRRGNTADVAHLVSYLASDAARYMTGAVIVLDGGATAGRVRG